MCIGSLPLAILITRVHLDDSRDQDHMRELINSNDQLRAALITAGKS